jgi:hypothetical protein
MDFHRAPNHHPLHAIVLASFNRESPAHDSTSIALCLAGGLVQRRSRRSGGGAVHSQAMKAYRLVAKDTLDYLESEGLIYRDSQGWYRRRPARSAPEWGFRPPASLY